jgi:hypothetical protein
MKTLLTLLLVAHGAIHLLGSAKAFGLADVASLRTSIGPGAGMLWLAAAVLLLSAAVVLWVRPRRWWIPALPGVVLSQALIIGAWGDARFGTVANVILLVPIALAVADLRPSSLRSRYLRDVRRALGGASWEAPPISTDDLATLPPQIRSYLQRVGAVGRPGARNVRARFLARIRGDAEDPWMEGTAEQYELFDPPERYFFMEVRRAGLPVDVYHRFAEGGASMRARLLGIWPVLDVSGPEMTRSETVTLLNDVFFLAPAALLDLPVAWEVLDAKRVRVTYVHAGHQVSAVAHFDDAGDLIDFESDDRAQLEGNVMKAERWSTPIHGYVPADGRRIPSSAEARWGAPGEEWTYADFVVEAIDYNVEDGPRR